MSDPTATRAAQTRSTTTEDPLRALLDSRQAWQRRAACRGAPNPELWFPGRGEPNGAAKAICRGCAVRAECLAFALANRENHGIWGGTSERERRRLRGWAA